MSQDIFNINKEFFVITSDNLTTVPTTLYGFIISDNGIIENENIEHLTSLSGAGSYVYVKNDGKSISIYRDVNGSYGLFLFKTDNFFALSNSFYLLVENLKNKFQLEFNYDFANFMLTMDLCSESLEATWIKEIKLLDKDAFVKIDMQTLNLSVDYINLDINTVPIDSLQGVSILDKWFSRWTRLLRNLQLNTNNISTDLSGGFDSRITFCLALMSGMDLNKIKINSIVSERNPCYAEDYEIASEITNYFGIKLNKSDNISSVGANFSIHDLVNINVYTKLPFHKQTEWGWISYKRVKKSYIISGDGGELFRNYWDTSIEEHVYEYLSYISSRYPQDLLDTIKESALCVNNNTKNVLMKKYHIYESNSKYLSKLLYMNTRSPRHFGGMATLIHCANIYRLQPLLDPEIQKLNFTNSNCPDGNLFIALLFVRYCPKLLDFKFQGNRSISTETIDYAKKINQMFPVDMERLLSNIVNKDYFILTEDTSVFENNNERISDSKMEDFFASIYNAISYCVQI